MWAMAISSLAVGKDLGELSADGDAYYRWTSTTTLGIINKRNECIPDLMMTGYISTVKWDSPAGGWNSTDAPYNSGTGPARTIGETYRATAQFIGFPGLESGYTARPVDNPTAIRVDPPGAAEGTEVSFTLTPGPSGNCFPNPAHYDWYKNTYVICGTKDDDFEMTVFSTAILIMQVTGPNSGMGIVSKRADGQRGQLPNPIRAVRLGKPHPAEGRPAGTYPIEKVGESDYVGWFWHLCVGFKDHGIPGAAEALAWLDGYYRRHRFVLSANHNIVPRSQ
jgi:hypothetical protein